METTPRRRRFIVRTADLSAWVGCEYLPQADKSAVRTVNRRLRASVIAALLLTMLLFAFPLTASAQTTYALAGNGRIYGQLRDGTKRNTPVVGQSITLQIAQGSNTGDLETTTTDARGMYSFDGLTVEKTISYAIYTLYQKAQYLSNLIDLSSKPQQQLNLTVYDATTSAAKIAIVQANILIDKADAQHGLLTISENFFFENLGLTTYVGSVAANGKKPNALLFSLPQGAQHVSLKAGFNGYQQTQVNGGFASTAAIPPGLSQFAFSFQVSYSATHYDFGYTVFNPTVSLSVLFPLDYHATSATLLPQGTTSTNGQVYQQLSAQQLLVNAQVHVELDGLPVTASANSVAAPGLSASWLILLVLAMLAIAGITWYLATRARQKAARVSKVRAAAQKARTQAQRKVTSQTTASKPTVAKARHKANGARSTPAPQQRRKAGDEALVLQETLLAELLELDKAYEAGTIKKAAYEERRAQLKRRLRSVLGAESIP